MNYHAVVLAAGITYGRAMGLKPRTQSKRLPVPRLGQVMTPLPCTISPDATLNQAHNMMRARNIRHLPVVRNNQVIGLVTVHDLHLVETFPGVEPDQVHVEDAMSEDLFFASSTDGLDIVVSTMAARKLGSVLVMDDGNLVGIFTSIDALRELASVWGRAAAG